jgi:hypothetical protein
MTSWAVPIRAVFGSSVVTAMRVPEWAYLDSELGESLQQFHRCREFGLFMVRQLRLQSA